MVNAGVVFVGRASSCPTEHHLPNPALERSAQRRCRWVPSALRAPAPAHLERLERKMWTAVVTQADADSLLRLFGSFHDGCIREAHVWGGYYVGPDLSMQCPPTPDLKCCLLIQRQWGQPECH